MSDGTRARPAALRFPPGPRRRHRGWLLLALALAAASVVAATRGVPSQTVVAAPLLAELVGHEPADHAAADASADGDTAAASSAGTDVDHQATSDGGGDADVGGDAPGRADDATGDPAQPLTPLLGEVDGLPVHLPAHEAVVVGFHEASGASHAIDPIGRLVANDNPTRFEGRTDRNDGVDYHVLSSRGRVHPATSAVDIVLVDDELVLAPISGTVTDVRDYYLYGEHLDHRVEIHADDAPGLRVVLVHVAGVQVEVGDEVTAGVTPLAATANRFPFSSQIDRLTEPDRWPHVHLEVQPADARRPGDAVDG